jgi:hypothetical protein
MPAAGREHAWAGVATGGPWAAWYPASAPFPAASVRGFEVTAGGKVVVTVAARRNPKTGAGRLRTAWRLPDPGL